MKVREIMEQRQDSLNDQIRDLIPIAQKNGMYDAADFLKRFVVDEDEHGSYHTIERKGKVHRVFVPGADDVGLEDNGPKFS